MRRFFNRLATGNTNHGDGVVVRGEVDRDTHLESRTKAVGERDEGLKEKVGMMGEYGDMSKDRNGTGDRVKALAARYETLSNQTNEIQQPNQIDKRRNSTQNWLTSSKSPNSPQSGKSVKGSEIAQNITPTSYGTRKERSPLFNFHKPLPSIGSGGAPHPPKSRASLPASTTGGVQLPESQLKFDGDEMLPAVLHASTMNSEFGKENIFDDQPAGSTAMVSHSNIRSPPEGLSLNVFPVAPQPTSAQQQKSVAFAPSPKKPIRSTSPLPSSFNSTPAMPERTMEEVNRHQQISQQQQSSMSGSQSVGNFARPTLASTARSRSGGAIGGKSGQGSSSTNVTQSSSTNAVPLISPIARQGTEKFPTTPVGIPSRPSSGQAFVMPKMLRSNSASNSTRRSLTAGGHAPTASNVSLVQNTRETSGQLPNSIPFSSQSSALGMLRSASPQSMGTGSSTSARGNPTPDFFGNSRRTSLQGHYYSGGSQAFTSSVRSIGAPSWSEMTQEDLVSNLGSRERTRQEVLWEIVASEERYVQELEKTKEFFLDILLHPHRFSPPGSPGNVHAATLATLEGRAPKTKQDQTISRNISSPSSTSVSTDLPIASRFLSASPGLRDSADVPFGSIDAAALSHANAQKNAGSRSPYSTGMGSSNPLHRPRSSGGSSNVTGGMSSMNASHSNLPSQQSSAKKDKEGKKSTTKESSTNKRWSQRRSGGSAISAFSSTQVGYDLTNGQGALITLPPPLRTVLEVIDNGILEGHALLSEALRVRYEEQWPLVRSLADVFTRFSYVLKHYRDYVIHLERALDCLEEAALMERAMRGKRLRKDRLSVMVGLGRAVASLEAAAAERGECGLAIFLAMPFQRLLKYPLLFQNLLFHTDASTYEFESTVQMVVDVEKIVRTIEDEKVNKEERDKTIDAFARIEGIKDRALLRPKADRILIEEKPMYQENPRRAISDSNENGKGKMMMQSASGSGQIGSQDVNLTNTAMSTPIGAGSGNLRASIRSKRSYRRLSDLLTLGNSNFTGTNEEGNPVTYTKAPNMGSKRDIWLIRFSDVELRCQRVGVTALPMVSSLALQPNMNDLVDNTSTNDPDNQTSVALTEDEIRMRDEFKRTKESKERMRALRNTTLRSKTRNLYKFVGVSSWKVTRERPNIEDGEGLDGLSTAMEEDEEQEEDIDEEEEEDDDGSGDNESSTSQETDVGVLDPEHYVRQSKLSFSYGGHDRVEPKLASRPNLRYSVRTMSGPTPKRHSMGSSMGGGQSNFTQTNPSMSPITSVDSGHNVSLSKAVVASSKVRADKFGNRLRSNDEHHQRRGSMPNVSNTNVHGSNIPTLEIISPQNNLNVNENVGENGQEGKAVQHNDLSTEDESSKISTRSNPNREIRPSFIHDRSLDSNLLLMGSLVQPSADR